MRSVITAGAAVALAALLPDEAPRVAAARCIAALRPESAAAARFDFVDPLRLDWHFIPRERRGVPLRALDDAERRATHRLLRSLLSPLGYERALGVIELEAVLRDIEGNPGRDPGAYWLSVFGDPAPLADGSGAPWMVRFEGHHLSLQWTGTPGGELAATPFFLGANPAEVRTGDAAGRQLLGSFEVAARELAQSLDAPQRARCLLAAVAPADVLFGPGQSPPDLAAGIPWTELSPLQQEQAHRLAAAVFDHVAPAARPAARPAETERTDRPQPNSASNRFAWAGSLSPGEPHYWRLVLGRDVIEYDNTQNGANHTHLLWRHVVQDFAAGWLKRHHDQQHRR
ncbi:MAG: DUF3500 domain-containing protein [Planctomycetes bacterium]|nr:DUF3500 domain-containing protein [Planctomycetota bacterium]